MKGFKFHVNNSWDEEDLCFQKRAVDTMNDNEKFSKSQYTPNLRAACRNTIHAYVETLIPAKQLSLLP